VEKMMNSANDFSYKMQQMKYFSCKNQGREPGRPKKKKHMPKKQINIANLVSPSL
jgi:hypothetical protein